jgi:hypothetical protein
MGGEWERRWPSTLSKIHPALHFNVSLCHIIQRFSTSILFFHADPPQTLFFSSQQSLGILSNVISLQASSFIELHWRGILWTTLSEWSSLTRGPQRQR